MGGVIETTNHSRSPAATCRASPPRNGRRGLKLKLLPTFSNSPLLGGDKISRDMDYFIASRNGRRGLKPTLPRMFSPPRNGMRRRNFTDASPPRNGRRGLKQIQCSNVGLNLFFASPPRNGRRGLKQWFTAPFLLVANGIASQKWRRGLKLQPCPDIQ